MAWRVELVRSAEKELEKLDRPVASRILRFLKERVASLDDPRSLAEPLRGPELGRFWKYRVGAYRIVVSIRDDELLVLVVRLGHRREV